MNVYRKIGEYYENLREENERELENRKKFLYASIPELKDVDSEIKSLGIKAALMSIEGQEVESYKIRIEELSDFKKELLVAHNIPIDFLDPIYSCKACKDTGILPDGKRCSCFDKKVVSTLYESSNLKYSMETENFETFNIEKFSNDVYIEGLPSPRENMNLILDLCWGFIKNFEDRSFSNLLFYGATGQGKTFLLNCIAREILDSGHSVVYQTSWELFDFLEERRFRRDDNFDENKFKALLSCDLLIIDDLGSEFSSKLVAAELFNIINLRLLSGKKCLFSTNLDPEELASTYSDRVFSRVFEKFIPIKFYGKDLRWE